MSESKQDLVGKFQSGNKLFASDMREMVYTLGASFSLQNSTIISETGTDIILKGASYSQSYWASIIGRIPNGDKDISGSGIASDGNSIYVSGGNNDIQAQALIIKLDLNGNVIWQKEIVEGSYGECVICKNGFVWLLYTDYDNGNNISIIQLDTDGNIVGNWNFTTDVYTAYGYEIDVDESNNVYFVGYQSNDTVNQFVIGKLNTSTGSIDWVYNLGDIDGEEGFGIKYLNGFVYTTGYDEQTGNGIINKMDVDGNLLWSKVTNTPIAGLSVTVDNNGNVYAAGSSGFNIAGLIALDSNGNKIYCNAYSVAPLA